MIRHPHITLLLLANLVFSSAASAKPHTLRLAESWPDNFPIFGEAVEIMANYAHQLSQGELLITIDSREKHGKPLGVMQLVQSGQYDMGHSASYYYKAKDINTLFFTTLPFGMTSPEQYAWFYHGGGMELMQQVYQPYNILAFPGGNSGNQMGGWFKKEVTTTADLKGLRVRLPGLAGDVMASLGVNTVNIPAGDLYSALYNGELDGVEWVGPSMDIDMGFHEVAEYYYTGWQEPGTELVFYVNEKAYQRLPPHLQQVLIIAMRLAAYDTYILAYHRSSEKLAELKQQFPHIKIRAFPTEVTRALRKQTEATLQQLAKSEDPLTEQILASIQTYQQKARRWTRISDQAYLNNSGI